MIQYGYNTLNRMVQETTPQGLVNYGYDVLGRRISMTVDWQSLVTYAYDANSRLTTVMASAGTFNLTYDAAGRRQALSYPNGVTTSYSYDTDSRITNILHQALSGTVENIGYGYDQAGNRIGVSRANGNATNLLNALQAAYDSANEMTQYNTPAPNLSYDANGNLLSDGTNSYTWNARNQLVAISGNVTASFSYDALGRRISKMINGTRTDYQYDGNDIVAEIGGGAVGATYVRSLNIDEPFARITSAGTEYYHTDALGSVFALTNAYGNTTATYSYEPFGYTLQTGISSNPFQYTGRENDGTGLYYYRARYYSPSLQRFISEDPIGFRGGINKYAYVLNSPLRYHDPYGLDKKPPIQTVQVCDLTGCGNPIIIQDINRIQPESVPLTSHEVLKTIAIASDVGIVGSALTGQEELIPVFIGTGAAATGLDIYLNSEDPGKDITYEAGKMLVSKPLGDVAGPLFNQGVDYLNHK